MRHAIIHQTTPRSRQTGLGALGWLVVLAIASFALTCLFRIGPVYIEYWQVKGALNDVFHNENVAGMTRYQLLDAVQKHFDVSEINVISAKDLRFTSTSMGTQVDADYEKRVPLIANIDVVVKFNNLKYTIPTPSQ